MRLLAVGPNGAAKSWVVVNELCGLPHKRDKLGGGTKRDGTKSTVDCSHCFVAGAFTMPELSDAARQARVKSELREIGLPSVAAWLFARKQPKLARTNPDSEE